MKIHKVKESTDSTLYALSEPAHNYVNCVHYDDDEVNKANLVDVRECADIVYNYLLVRAVNDKLVFYPADNQGHGLSSPLLIADPGVKFEHHFVTLYGNRVVFEDKLVVSANFDDYNWSPDHKL
jgi:hypothetical protein